MEGIGSDEIFAQMAAAWSDGATAIHFFQDGRAAVGWLDVNANLKRDQQKEEYDQHQELDHDRSLPIMRPIIISLGANRADVWGPPEATVVRAILELQRAGLSVEARSPLYSTAPVGVLRQPRFINAIVVVRGSIAPAALLRLAKTLEHAAGRRRGPRWGPRPLDIDVIDHGGRIIGRNMRRRVAGRLILPHPEAHRRGFVLVPLAEAWPGWRHPLSGRSAGALLRIRPELRRGIRHAV